MTEVHARRRKAITRHFPDVANSPDGLFLSLHPYLERPPERFYSRQHFEGYLRWLVDRHDSNRRELADYLDRNLAQIHRALVFLSEINRLGWHDSLLSAGDDYSHIRFIDEAVHPGYLRLMEGVFYRLAHALAFFARSDRGKSTDGLDLHNVLEELQRTPLSRLTSAANRTVRNAIAHGRFSYGLREIEYRDRSGDTIVLSTTAVLGLFDDLLDACNGIALALRVFLLSHSSDGYKMPLQMLVEELQAETDAPWWDIEACVVSELADKTQLVLYARPTTRSYEKVFYSTVASATLAERLAPGFDRYFFSLRSPKAWQGWAGFDGHRLARNRTTGAVSLADSALALESPGVFYVPTPRLPRVFGAIETLIYSFRIHVPMAIRESGERLGLPEIEVRHTSMHRQGGRSVLEGRVTVSSPTSTVDQGLVRQLCSRITRAALSAARRATPRSRMTRYLPLGYARIAVFARDYRTRRLISYGLGPDLTGTIQVKHIQQIKAPDIAGATIEQLGPYRIAWNSRWLKSNQKRDP